MQSKKQNKTKNSATGAISHFRVPDVKISVIIQLIIT